MHFFCSVKCYIYSHILNLLLSSHSFHFDNFMNGQLSMQCLRKYVLEIDKGISFDHCKKWIYHKCKELSDFDLKYLQNKNFWLH